MQIKSIKHPYATAGLVLAGTLCLLSTCGGNNRTLRSTAKENGYTKSEIRDIFHRTKASSPMYTTAERQAVIDSMTYRGLLNETGFANDYFVVSDFERMSDELRTADYVDMSAQDLTYLNKQYNVTVGEIDSIDILSKKDKYNLLPKKAGARRQYRYDNFFFKKFFENLGLMNDKQFSDKFEKASEKIKP